MRSFNFKNERACLNCFEVIEEGYGFLEWLIKTDSLCQKCRKNLKMNPCVVYKQNLKIQSLYAYQGEARDLFLKFKDGQDRWLKDVFLFPYKLRFWIKYYNYIIVLVPSSEASFKIRGYLPNQLLLDQFNLEIRNDIFTKGNIKQSTQTFKVRKNIKNHIRMVESFDFSDRKLLLFDDLSTTGYTLQACYELLKMAHPKKIKVFSLFHHEI